jgi:hypothetical protein
MYACFIASGWAWHYEPVLCRWSERRGFDDWWAHLWHGVTFEHRQVLPWAVKCEGMSANESVYTGTVGPDWRRRWFELDIAAMGWCCSAPNGYEVSSCVGGAAARP